MRKSWENCKKVTKGHQKVPRKLPESPQQVAKSHEKVTGKLVEIYKKIAKKFAKKSCRNLARKFPESCQKIARQLPESCQKVMRKSTPLLKLQTIADMSVLVCSVRWERLTPLQGGYRTMACLMGKGHGENCLTTKSKTQPPWLIVPISRLTWSASLTDPK